MDNLNLKGSTIHSAHNDMQNRTRGLRRRKAINTKSGKKRLILAQLHRSCVSLRTVFELPSYDPVEFSLT